MSLLAKVTKGGGFRGLLNYLRQGSKDKPRVPPGEVLGGNLSGTDPRQLAAEFKAVRQLRPDCKKPVLHVSLSLPNSQDLTAEQWQAAAATWMKGMGIDERRPHVIFKHTETDHQHIHLVISRVGLDGTLIREQRGDYKLAHKAAAAASLAVGLEPQPKPDPEARGPRMTKQDRREIESGQTPDRLALAARIDEVIAQASGWEDLKTRAALLGIEIQERSSNTGGAYGIKCRLKDGAWLKGSQVGKAYTYSSILKRLAAGGADIADLIGSAPAKPRGDILSRLTTKQTSQSVEYCWASGHIAVVDLGNELKWRSGSTSEAAALAAVAKAKDWKSVKLGDRGSQVKNDEAWLAYVRAGIAVTNYKPSEEVYARWVTDRDGTSGPSAKSQEASQPGGTDPTAGVTPGRAGASQEDPGRLDQVAGQTNQERSSTERSPTSRKTEGDETEAEAALVEAPIYLKEQAHGPKQRAHQPNPLATTRTPPPSARGRLRQLSKLGLVHVTGGSEMLLPRDVSTDLDDKRARPDSHLRRDFDHLTSDDERRVLAGLPELIRRFSSNAVDGRVKQEIRDALPTKIRDRLRDEQEDERRRLLFQFSSNLAGHPGGRPILSYEDAVNLLAQSPTDAGREALRALLDAADRHSQISTTRPAAAGPSMTM